MGKVLQFSKNCENRKGFPLKVLSYTVYSSSTCAFIGARIQLYSSLNLAVNDIENSCSSDSASKPRPLHSPSYHLCGVNKQLLVNKILTASFFKLRHISFMFVSACPCGDLP